MKKFNINKKELTSTLKRLLGLVAILLIAGIIISAVENRKHSNVKEVIIDIDQLGHGYSFVNVEDIRLIIERRFGYNLEGVPLAGLDVERVERVLEEDPFIYESDVYVDAKNRIHIHIGQRDPLVRIIDKNGANYYLDRNGHKMPLSKHYAARVLVVTGNLPPYVEDFLETKKENSLANVFRLAETLNQDDFLLAQIEQIYVNSKGDITLIPKVGNQKIILGPYEDVGKKLKRLKTFYKEGIPYEGWQKYKTINLSFKDQIVCKKK